MRQRGHKILRTYIVVPFTDKIVDSATEWKGLKSLCIAVIYWKGNTEPTGSNGGRYFISSRQKAE